jgi:hypothetical protein
MGLYSSRIGYTTEFSGRFDLDKRLTHEHAAALRAFNEEEHDDGPSLYCQWIPTEDERGIEWDGVEKFYKYAEWLQVVIDRFVRPWGYTLSGGVTWQGDDVDDVGTLRVVDHRVQALPGVGPRTKRAPTAAEAAQAFLGLGRIATVAQKLAHHINAGLAAPPSLEDEARMHELDALERAGDEAALTQALVDEMEHWGSPHVHNRPSRSSRGCRSRSMSPSTRSSCAGSSRDGAHVPDGNATGHCFLCPGEPSRMRTERQLP